MSSVNNDASLPESIVCSVDIPHEGRRAALAQSPAPKILGNDEGVSLLFKKLLSISAAAAAAVAVAGCSFESSAGT
jgi:hypothetical protein